VKVNKACDSLPGGVLGKLEDRTVKLCRVWLGAVPADLDGLRGFSGCSFRRVQRDEVQEGVSCYALKQSRLESCADAFGVSGGV
jgi:hypothetical protein